MATKADLERECESLRKQLQERHPIIRVTADGTVQELSPRKAIHILAKAEAKRVNRIVTVIIRAQ